MQRTVRRGYLDSQLERSAAQESELRAHSSQLRAAHTIASLAGERQAYLNSQLAARTAPTQNLLGRTAQMQKSMSLNAQMMKSMAGERENVPRWREPDMGDLPNPAGPTGKLSTLNICIYVMGAGGI